MHPVRMMKVLLPLVVWLTELITWIHCKGGIGFGIRREIFFLNLEDGYFGCQVNQSTDVLQLYELSRLCDGYQDCFQGSDELARELKCTNNCANEAGLKCQNGACLDSLCHCNDGFGGCSCEVPDENECKYRPCDVFAHCTNTLGSFHCSCYPGYIGDGFHCQDINECEDPSIAARCVPNAECCNLPAHFLCRCKPGFEGDGEIECRDINECALPNACGLNAVCRNYAGNYTCDCKEGYRGNPFTGCTDVDECQTNLCASGALCTNFPGGFHCECPLGTTGDAYQVGCLDINECAGNPCGLNALCKNSLGSFQCICPAGFVGDPYHQCVGGEPLPSVTCAHCPPGVPCNPETGACGQEPKTGPKKPIYKPTPETFTDINTNVPETAPPLDEFSPDVATSSTPAATTIVSPDDEWVTEVSSSNSTSNARGPMPPFITKIPDSATEPPSDEGTTVGEETSASSESGEDASSTESKFDEFDATTTSPSRTTHGYVTAPHTYLPPVTSSLTTQPMPEEPKPETITPSILQPPFTDGETTQPADEGGVTTPSTSSEEPSRTEPTTPVENKVPGTSPPTPDVEKPAEAETTTTSSMSSETFPPSFVAPSDDSTLVTSIETATKATPSVGNAVNTPQPRPSDEVTIPGTDEVPRETTSEEPVTEPADSTEDFHDSHETHEMTTLAQRATEPVSEHESTEKKTNGESTPTTTPEGSEGAVTTQKSDDASPAETPAVGTPSTTESSGGDGTTVDNETPAASSSSSTSGKGVEEPPATSPEGITEAATGKGDSTTSEAATDQTDATETTTNEISTETASPASATGGAPKATNGTQSPADCAAISQEINVKNPRNKTIVLVTGTNRLKPKTSNRKPVASSCLTNSDCSSGEICKNNICTLNNVARGMSSADRPDLFEVNGTAKFPQPCQLDTDCLETEACYKDHCEDLCSFTNLCAPTAKCHVVKHRPVCTCPPGHQGNPAIKCYLPKTSLCFTDANCGRNEVCLHGVCQSPCSAHNPCAQNAICLNTASGADCRCVEGFQGNGFVGCSSRSYLPLPPPSSVCQYNEDCPPDKLCDRLNRICINPCSEESCGENAVCYPNNHKAECHCLAGSVGNPYLTCASVIGCRSDNECAPNEACIEGKCSNPCRCGPYAVCDVIHHRATCKCLPGYSGNPLAGCQPPLNPCQPNPCGMHALCELDNGNPICFCPKGMTGNPFKQCIPEGDECRPNPCGPNSGCRVVQGSALCFCLPEFEGDPPISPCRPPQHPCHPSPCGPNTQCTLHDGYAKCTCLPGYIESPNTIRGCMEKRNQCDPNPCGFGAVCDPTRSPCCFCPENTVGNPYKYCGPPVKTLCQPGPCGHNADCYITGNTEQCYCKSGYQGDPYTTCHQIPSNPCYPNPCGPSATCSISHDGRPTCTCPPGIVLDPHGGCTGLECTIDEDCQINKACVGYRCRDPCPGACGVGASCRVEKHHPVCTCNHGLTGNPLIRCNFIEAQPERNPCMPSPCGPNTYCRISGKRAICSCVENFIGDPKKGCRPECTMNSDCPPNKVCSKYQCKDPCSVSNVCGLGAVCICRDHNPTCVCREGFAGNPFVQCLPRPERPVYPNTTLPCTPNPCDPSSTCQVYGGEVAMCDPCSGPSGHYNPSCHPECLYNSDCPFNLACLSQKCVDPCPGSCGVGAQCVVVHHAPVCSCPRSLTGNPYEHCSPITHPAPVDHCLHDRCGANAICRNTQGHITCECPPGYFGNPYLTCRPECVIDTDCPPAKSCWNNKCANPCHGVCGVKAQCQVINHLPVCYCPQDFTGDPFVTCYPNREYLPPTSLGKPGNPCDPSPCGSNSRCLISSQGFATCSCLPGYHGSPPLCKPECIVSTECPLTQSCVNQKCVNPCVGVCGVGAHCYVMNHNPICACPANHIGDPFVMCILPPVEPVPTSPLNPCEPSPCGPNSICQVREGHPVCSCLENYLGSPPYCRPECVMNQECPFNLACIHEKCRNPCSNSCGLNAKCDVVNHTPYCTCLPGYEGDAFVSCSKKPATVLPPVPTDPCAFSPCGENARCTVVDGAARCDCIPPYIGNPYTGTCRPECVMNSDCPPNAACLSSHCRDPCPGVCGINAECTVVNHIPTCTCFPDHIGDPFQSCRRKPVTPVIPINVCEPSPCGPNSVCLNNGNAICSCKPNFVGTPPNCRPECVVSSECHPHLACISQRCSDPCPGTCGLHARCTVINHSPICSCPPHTVGDPFVRCAPEEPRPRPPPIPVDPCSPSPCGANSECQAVGSRPVCSCIAGMLGTPPYCRPECLIHADCPTKLACLNSKCRDPCVGSCGFNAQCTVINHQPVCSCLSGYQGDPFSSCSERPIVVPTPPPEPCVPSPCGPNAVCKELHGAGSCTCLSGYSGDPYLGCRPECVQNSDCTWHKACVNNKCVDPCSGACGLYAECKVVHHSANCFCISGYTGNPVSACRKIPHDPIIRQHPCMRSPCGPYSQCHAVEDHAICACLSGYFGSPPNCHPECVSNADCPLDKSCVNQICSNPCPGVCGYNARCHVVNHNPICSCNAGYSGDPFVRCVEQIKPPIESKPPSNPCIPSPCGPNAICQVHGDVPSCSCLQNYIGRPPNCRPECTINTECEGNLACQNDRCVDPCPGSCGANANCIVVHHTPVCTCVPGYTGDPFTICSQVIEHVPTEIPDPCHPSPCGANAICKERNGAGSCQCLPEFTGDPYTGCRPECVLNSECPQDKACINNKCVNPCVGICGSNADCRVINHAPSCTCVIGYVGNPLVACHPEPKPAPKPEKPRNPCIPSPCGPYSECRQVDGHAVCSCQKDYIGTPPACRPECMTSSECPQDKACVKQRCTDPCPGTCGLNARCQVVNHNPICSCSPGYTGDPFVRCLLEPPPQPEHHPPANPCVPTPCGPNSQCRVVGSSPACTCVENYVGRPPNCRPECIGNDECPPNLSCQNERCRDPCLGSCGPHTTCSVVKHVPLCNCVGGYTGDPFAGCYPLPPEVPQIEHVDPCNPSPCGANAVCKAKNGAGSCVCLPEYFGDPYSGCRPECVTNSDCDRSRACLNNKCKDPCPGTCGLNAECRVVNHAPSCSCLPGYVGDPISACHLVPSTERPKPSNPCLPSPCGPYSECRRVDNHAVCSCQKEYIGTPPACRPECMVSSECALNKACVNKKCSDPCPGTCGPDARCQVVNHNPICSCAPGFTGDPFVRCIKEPPAEIPKEPSNPCVPSPCGPNSECRVVGNSPACSCLPNYIGRPPSCRPECTINAECPGSLACQNERCRDPCPGSCGIHAVCVVTNHAPRCSCENGYTGDPFVGCSLVPTSVVTEKPPNPCHPSPCGANAVCKERNGAGSCTCLPEYLGDPYTGCRPECVANSDCDRSKACVNNKCRDPCPGTCGLNAECRVINHAPSCTCLPRYSGDATTACHPIPEIEPELKNPCLPSPCGPYSECREVNKYAVCSCKKNYVGSPPSCKPECMVSSECPQNKACINQKCVDPCSGTCGQNARCQVVNHNPICSCPYGYTGDPFIRCTIVEQRPTTETPSGNPCVPSPCGPNSECRVVGNTPACSCQLGYIGRPPNCRPECAINAECPGNLACQNERCRDPCPGSCGVHTSCVTVNHAPQCTCETGYTGDPFAGCVLVQITTTERPRNPCNPSPCGPNAVCKERNGAGSCVCLPEYFGDPYTGCRPECVTNEDCERTKACQNNKCRDPCPGTCGIHAECRVLNHAPSCSCLPGYTGNPLSVCTVIPSTTPTPVDPCNPSPCGPNSICREVNKHAVCSCITGFIGSPPACRPECLISSECALDKACVNQKCVDPCPGTCGVNTRCQVLTHKPICSCLVGYTGDPFVRCTKIESTTAAAPPANPCVPSPCGPYSQCRVINNTPACSCNTNYIGTPPNCRPQCVLQADCPSNLACKNERCVDPCPGSCGTLALCQVINHNPVCTCPPGYVGNALVSCQLEPTTLRTPEIHDPCFPNPCGGNAECINKNEVAACRCLNGFFGDPYTGCKRECESNSDCGLPLACIGYKCIDPCPGTCGSEAICTTVNHIPICSCPPGYSGDPFLSCRPVPLTPKPPSLDPCYPSPCGPNSQCRAVNEQAVCTCLPNYIGSPPSCRPECVVSSECALDKACINQKCADPCPNTCGLYAICNVRNHNPFCTCAPQYTGDPFVQCSPIPVTPSSAPTDAPPSCVPSPCGPNAQCKILNGNPVCSCLPDFIGSPPSCRPECVISSECASQLACINQHCRDPCPGSCGINANCHVVNHVPICQCNEGHTGDPFSSCSLIPITTPQPVNPCNPSPCGPNANCHGDGICECLPEYTGNPYESCRPECVLSTECPRDKACIRNKCQNPCIGTCGQGANCDVINHIPTCSCPPEFIGDPFTLCKPKPQEVPPSTDPCVPSPCGPNSVCRNHNGQAVCSCLPEYQGSPPMCRPECITNEECSSMLACVHKKCANPCVGVCGLGARCEVINHSPICSCREGQTGDPFRNCYDLPPPLPPPPRPHTNPCLPSPCGPNSQCAVVNELPSCSCLPGFIGAPPSCRPECLINGDCPRNLACINNKCKDPCPGSCGLNAVCQVISNTVSCSCQTGYTGNPFEQCVYHPTEIPINPCEPSPCGVNAVCKQHNGAGSCSCIPGYQGNPYEECRPECVLSSDCPSDKACIRNKCQDPCPGICGSYASCTVINHVPTCNCIPGYVGDPFTSCHLQPTVDIPPETPHPCTPSPCGPNSKCVERNGNAVCSCLPEYQGSPPNCKPECVVNAECPTNRACHKFKCTDPCPGTCGVNARCEVIHHRPICSCPAGYTGDPFQRCYLALPEPKPPTPPPNPCVPSPCGPYSECQVIGSQASCRCKENYIGVPPQCRPECVVNTDCSPILACISEKCRDPCPGSCGLNAKCSVQNHIPICSCLPDYTGDPFTQCAVIIDTQPPPKPNPCYPSPCGSNANCNEGICTCIPNYFGDPYTGCRPECVMNTDCAPTKACVNQHCIDPCPGVCGQDAKCDVVNHIPTCSCPPQTSGDAFVACRPIVPVDVDPCNPSPCGPNSICRVSNGHAVCSCQPGLVGSPPSCKPECVVSAECALTQACLQYKCRDPCPGTCGLNAKCNVINHNPICSCPSGYVGDPFRHCQLAPTPPPEPPKPINPCVPSPCGPNAVCQVHGDTPACSCLPNYIGSPPSCRPECTINPECASNLACINQRCSDPCTGSCGFNAVCSVINHVAICSCIQGYTGDPFASCQLITTTSSPPPPSDPCYPSPCGPNARCRSENGVAACECLPEYQGNPYEGCRPECLISSDCIMSKACIKNKCQDPCPGTCGLSAICSVSNHIPICYCPEGTTGDAFRACQPIMEPKEPEHHDPCVPSPCGPNTRCQVNNEIAVCECLPGFEGSPTTSGCHPECVINADCPRNKACMNNKCVDPCSGVCGYKAICQTLNHSPVCSCPPPLIGDPFYECKEAPASPVDPCYPSPCGQNGHCRVINGIASCTYPECIINQDCSRDKACFGQKCRDPCVGACGINALCQVVNHDAVCSCPAGYYGEPKQQCRQELPPEPKPECYTNDDCSNDKACINHACRNPCAETSNVCASNAECRVQKHRPYCSCKHGMTGNAQSFCYEIGCRADTDCIPAMACVNRECIDPCGYTQCGTNAQCRVDSSHKSRCHCPESYFGNPMAFCERPQCTSNSDCPPDLACVNQKCQSPCACAHNALCNVIHHVPSCQCPPGYTGNPHDTCLIAPIEPSVECKTDADCSSKLACFGGVCKNPCVETKPCGENGECRVVDTLPLRTMTCHCPPGYVGDADVSCRKVPEKSAGCQSNDDCPYSNTCINQQCVEPCLVRNPCALNAECQSANHKANCKCPPGLIGDPFANCYKVSVALPECTIDSDCPSSRACINEKCQEPCKISNPCGVYAECNTLQHRPVCNCPDGWAGNPQIHCYKPECKADSDCLYDKACRNNNCISPCASISCGMDAECVVRAHVPHCTCPPGTQGNPLLSCVAVGCQYNEDCADHEACDRLNRKCRPVCERDTCAERAICSAKAHQPICACPPGTVGDAYTHCSDSRTPIAAECTKDSECPSKLACINQKCENPCRQPGICSSDQECQVLDTYPVRTVMCVCPADSIATNDGHCKPIVSLECKSDDACRDIERCVRGSCIETCKIDPCGLNALCNARHHHSVCSCPSHYTGNAHVECTNAAVVPMPPTIPECTKDDDCPFNLGCRNQKCVSPCLVGDACGRGAFCHVENHKPVCRCPVGYEGSPSTECRPPSSTQVVGCISNSDCSPEESCVNKLCVSPCNCGPNSECRVIGHYPMCYCKPGYSGNPQISCVKVECESDEQCNFDQTCYNGNCVNPCILNDPCGVNAECYGDNHRAACKCQPTFSGDPFGRCEAVECQMDADCPQDRACVNQRCVNPCADAANPPCAPNAICYVRNHATGCRCPDYLPVGNPLAYCERSAQPTPAEPECRLDSSCPSQLACINEHCVNPCVELKPCASSARCNVLDSSPLRTLTCTCPDGWISNKDGECKAVIVPKPPGCESDDDCSTEEACTNRLCRNPCNCGLNSECFVKNHRPICSCKAGYEGNPNIVCKVVGCRRDSECDSGRACINGNCVNPCLVKNPCGPNAECYAQGNAAECQCASGYRGNPYERCHVVGCRSNNDCPDDRSCINAQCINPCVYEHPCAADAQCRVKNHIALCRCPAGMSGNPYTFCQEERKVECHDDGDCPSVLACFNSRCQNPCTVLEPCERPANCESVATLPVRTMICMCPSGYISNGVGKCKAIPAITDVACTSDSQCPSDRACVNGICKNPCNCGPNAECTVRNNKPICSCIPGYEGNPNIECLPAGCRSDDDCSSQNVCQNRACVPACAADGSSCGTDAKCYGIQHRAVCECPSGLTGDPQVGCTYVTCKSDSECPTDKACVNKKCVNPCSQSKDCVEPAVCVPYNHKADCSCPPGFTGNPATGCESGRRGCQADSECPSRMACINEKCVNPCEQAAPCGKGGVCNVLDTTPVRTMICECPPGYEGNAVVECTPISKCDVAKGFIKNEKGECVCPPDMALNLNDECRKCLPEMGYKVDDSGHCVCALERGLIINERGECVCPPEHGYQLDYFGNCVPARPPGCESNDDCPDNKTCENRKCVNPCDTKICGINAFCNATNHEAICQCPPNYHGNPDIMCNTTYRRDFPKPEMIVSCLSDGVQVRTVMTDAGFNGVLYVKGHSKEEECRRLISVPQNAPTREEIFKVLFNTCGLVHINGQASFVLVIQKHPKLVTYKAQAYHIKCVYTTSEQNVTIGFNVSMLTTAGTIANTGPPPTCMMKIVTDSGREVNSAEIGENLVLQVDVHPTSIYGGFARSCVAKTLDNNVENEYIVTDENGCATDPNIFGEWQHDPETQSLRAEFNAFKFPSSDNIRFQCNIRVCFGRCQPVNCRGVDAFGKRRKRETSNRTDVDVLHEGQLREEITIESNAIFTIERREERLVNPTEEPQTAPADDICISVIGLIVSLIITALLALVAVAVSVSCWLMAYRRQPSTAGPLPHPSELPAY